MRPCSAPGVRAHVQFDWQGRRYLPSTSRVVPRRVPVPKRYPGFFRPTTCARGWVPVIKHRYPGSAGNRVSGHHTELLTGAKRGHACAQKTADKKTTLKKLLILQTWFGPFYLCKKFYKKLKNVSCEYNRVNGWNSTLQAAWYIRHFRIIWFLWSKRTIWLLILSFTQNISFARVLFDPYEGYRSVTPLDAAGSTGRFSITILCSDTI